MAVNLPLPMVYLMYDVATNTHYIVNRSGTMKVQIPANLTDQVNALLKNNGLG